MPRDGHKAAKNACTNAQSHTHTRMHDRQGPLFHHGLIGCEKYRLKAIENWPPFISEVVDNLGVNFYEATMVQNSKEFRRKF